MTVTPDLQSHLEGLRARDPHTLLGTLGITITEASLDRVVATMPVTPAVHQPFGLLHGGASVALAESVASVGAYLNVAARGQGAVGLEINANHLRGKRGGTVTATAVPVHRGRTTHVWSIEITDEEGKMVCVSRCTLAIVPLEGGGA
ncbi:hotdog fold thioesterase [Deinococcus pimensis]|uniref:hotdog fold thioesterase n=1 Tax=Deinococcus pimensis TaxID=309888 RepID=UPI0004B325BC|nr:hotdog fold thioesterase [Deinococcus pimensis]